MEGILESKTHKPLSITDLRMGSMYLAYNIKVYIETLMFITENMYAFICYDTKLNSILETHLLHARNLINFLKYDRKDRSTDITAYDYFWNGQFIELPTQNAYLKEQADIISNHLLHITSKPVPNLISQFEWPIRLVSDPLIEGLENFFMVVDDSKLDPTVKPTCLKFLALGKSLDVPENISAST